MKITSEQSGLTARIRFKETGMLYDKNPRQVQLGGHVGICTPWVLGLLLCSGSVYCWVCCHHHPLPSPPPHHHTKTQVKGHIERGKERIPGITIHGNWDNQLFADMPDGTSMRLWTKNPPAEQPTRYNLTSWAIKLNEITPGLEEKLAPTDCRLRPDQAFLERGMHDEVWHGGLVVHPCAHTRAGWNSVHRCTPCKHVHRMLTTHPELCNSHRPTRKSSDWRKSSGQQGARLNVESLYAHDGFLWCRGHARGVI